jgi:hypothetical protein
MFGGASRAATHREHPTTMRALLAPSWPDTSSPWLKAANATPNGWRTVRCFISRNKSLLERRQKPFSAEPKTHSGVYLLGRRAATPPQPLVWLVPKPLC